MSDFNIGLSYSDTVPRFETTSAGLKQVPIQSHHHKHHHKPTHKESNIEHYGKPIASGLILLVGIALLPETILASIGSLITGITFGPIVEGAAMDYLANATFVQAATRAGAITAGGKYLNLFSVFTKPKKQIITAVKHPLDGWTETKVLENIERLGIDTPKDSFMLWSGMGKDGVTLSKDFALANKGMTLEMTPGGSWLQEMDLFAENSPFTFNEAIEIWKKVSLMTIRKASGQVRAVVGRVSPDSVYNAELREMLMNPKITGIDELNIKPRVLFHTKTR